MLTKPQERFLWAAMKQDPARLAATSTIVMRRMKAAGLVEHGGKGWTPTIAGLEALRDWHARRDARSGCIAYMQSLAEVERALEAAKAAASDPVAMIQQGPIMLTEGGFAPFA